MKLQLACDLLSIEEAISLVKQIKDYIDIIEIGTPFIVKEGMLPVKEITSVFPDKIVLADIKIMDGGKAEATYAFEAGAKIVTVMAAAELQTIQNVIEISKRYSAQVLVDMLGVKNLRKRAAEIDKLRPDYICVHTAFDVQYKKDSPIQDLINLKAEIINSNTAIAGGLSLDNINKVISVGPEIIIIGGAIINAENPQEYTKKIFQLLRREK